MANNCKQCFNTHYQPHYHPTTKSLWLCSNAYCGPPHPSRRIMVGDRSRQPKRHTFDFLKSFSIYIKYKSEMKYDWKNSIACAIIVFVTKKWEIWEGECKNKFQWQFLILCLWWLRSSFFLVTMRSYRRSILLKSVKDSRLRAFIKKTTWNL